MGVGNENLPIGVMDSGVGGLTVVKELIRLLPCENIVYFGDSKRMPYGNKTEEEILYLANTIIAFLENKGVKGILLACNTVSSQIEQLKSNVPIIGIIEAGCEAALEVTTSEEVGLIATVATVRSGVYERTMSHMDPSKRIRSNDSRRLPKIINDHLEKRDLLNVHIKECIDPILEKGEIKELILGCSHFPIIQREIQELYPSLTLINPANKQVEKMQEYLSKADLLRRNPDKSVQIYTTDGLEEFKLTLARLGIRDYSIEKVELLEEDRG